ncbi:iron ABC transporter permease [Labrenzia sp. OB1]|uniref:FecCD family ABC transporter permease n=1 Tax=Labrenzia sp. OB1 TaxID=1561204 RepID=UPI0007B1F525|nr:iron ABC transporter permease [Labrenzia sp. OB1]KZM50938.1 ABC transporter permease [Labrenzia sp. OB1]
MRRGTATDGKPVLRLANGLQMRTGNLLAGCGLVAATLILAAWSTGLGLTDTGLADLLRALSGSSLSDAETYALLTVRLPRILLGFMVGWAVALSGALLQSIARNPLADPGLFGFSQGSMIMIMLLLVIAPVAPKSLVALAAVTGGLCVAGLLLWLVGGERSSGLTIVLLGIAVETVLSSFGSLLLLYLPTETSITLSEWLAGSLFQANWSVIAAFTPLFVLGLVGSLLAGGATSAYDLGTEMAQALGEPVARSRPLILLFAVVLSAAAVTAVGPLVFLGVLAPHIAGFLSPAVGRARLLLSGLVGGILVVAADALTRGIAAGLPLPLGLSLTMVGVPLFIIALRLQALRKLQSH